MRTIDREFFWPVTMPKGVGLLIRVTLLVALAFVAQSARGGPNCPPQYTASWVAGPNCGITGYAYVWGLGGNDDGTVVGLVFVPWWE
jgi:hypothetical protein